MSSPFLRVNVHPRVFLDRFWRNDIRNEVFVAMSFDPRFERRWEGVFRPAIESISIAGRQLKAIRVDIRKSGDSILSEINDGIAHSQLVLADISVIDSLVTGGSQTSFRNGNVMFEVGIALACRQPVEVVLVRDDAEKLLFDISHIPVIRFDPANEAAATKLIQAALMDRFRERDLLKDLRLARTLESLTQFEINLIRTNSHLNALGWQGESLPAAVAMALPELLKKQVLRLAQLRTDRSPDIYVWTTFGRVIADRLKPPPAQGEEQQI
jgi:hypothetical protein